MRHKNKKSRFRRKSGLFYHELCWEKVGGDGFEPPKASPADLQSAPFGHSGNHPCFSKAIAKVLLLFRSTKYFGFFFPKNFTFAPFFTYTVVFLFLFREISPSKVKPGAESGGLCEVCHSVEKCKKNVFKNYSSCSL